MAITCVRARPWQRHCGGIERDLVLSVLRRASVCARAKARGPTALARTTGTERIHSTEYFRQNSSDARFESEPTASASAGGSKQPPAQAKPRSGEARRRESSAHATTQTRRAHRAMPTSATTSLRVQKRVRSTAPSVRGRAQAWAPIAHVSDGSESRTRARVPRRSEKACARRCTGCASLRSALPLSLSLSLTRAHAPTAARAWQRRARRRWRRPKERRHEATHRAQVTARRAGPRGLRLRWGEGGVGVVRGWVWRGRRLSALSSRRRALVSRTRVRRRTLFANAVFVIKTRRRQSAAGR